MNSQFRFYTQHHLVKLLGIRAKNPIELLERLKKVPVSSIYYHTHRFLQQHHYLSPGPPNDFAYWLMNILNLKELGEDLASVDIISFNDLEKLRSEFIRILETYISKGKHVAESPEGGEFHLMSCITVVLSTPYIANNTQEFIEALNKISVNSLYFHIFEARMRIKKDDNDFSAWFRSLGEDEIAKRISNLDPYTITLEGLREKLIRLVTKYARH